MGQLPTQLSRFRRLVLLSPVLSLLSLSLLLWTYRHDPAFQSWIGYQRAAAEPQIHVEVMEAPGQTVQRNVSNQLVAASHRPPFNFFTHPAPGEEKEPFIGVNGTKTVLVAAYQEHRTARKEVRVVAVVLRSEAVAYRCVLRCGDRLHVSEGVCEIHSDHFGFAYGTADIMCPLPSDCGALTHIAVAAAAHFSEDMADTDFLEVKNQKTQFSSFPYNFTVCISTMFDFTNVLQLVQSLEMLQLLGVDRVVVYKTSTSPETQRALDYYTQRGLVEVIPWSMSRYLNVSRGWLPMHGPGDLHYFGQIPALTDCMYRYMYRSKYLAQHDIDELILPQRVSSWSELLPVLEQKYGADLGYMFENNLFPNTAHRPPPDPQLLPPHDCCPGWGNMSGVNILDFLYQEPIISETHFSNFKLIVNPRVVFRPSVHGLLRSLHGCAWVDRDIARMYHTRAPRQTHLTADQLIYDGRLLSFSSSLIPKVNSVFRDSGLLPEDGPR